MTTRRALGTIVLLAVAATITVLLATPTNPGTEVLSAEALIEPNTPSLVLRTTTTTTRQVRLEDRLLKTTTTLDVPVPTTIAPTTTTSSAGTSTTTEGSGTTTKPAKPTTTTTTPPTTTTTVSGGYSSSAESSFASSINNLRASKGLNQLTRNSSLDAEARSWAEKMARDKSLSHSSLGRLIPPWTAVAENVGAGPSVKSVFSALVASSTHVGNMLGNFTDLGVGVWVDSQGTIWTVHLFVR